MGGPSREREISFAGGRTVFDNLDKRQFTPVPLFVDSFGTLIALNWQNIYKGTLRDFYPPTAVLPDVGFPCQLYIEHIEGLTADQYAAAIASIGRRVEWNELSGLIDFAFLTLHGAYGEDGNIQGMLEWLGIPYSGSGIAGSAIGINKAVQRQLLPKLGFASPACVTVKLAEVEMDAGAVSNKVQAQVGFPCVVKNPLQGSSIGVSIVRSEAELVQALYSCAFVELIKPETWRAKTREEKIAWLQRCTDPRSGLGLPLYVTSAGQRTFIRQPDILWQHLDALHTEARLEATDAAAELLVEAFIEGEEFSVIVIEQPDGAALALPPTHIIKTQPLFDYRSKYLPGQARKVTPIDLPDDQIRLICAEAERLMHALFFSVYARIDGILGRDGTLYFNDPNTTSGMLPGSFFFHQAAEAGLNPTQFLTYIILRSLQVRAGEQKIAVKALALHEELRVKLAQSRASIAKALRVGVVLGGYSSERHVSVESGRNVYEKLSSTPGYTPIPLFLLHHKHLSEEQIKILGLAESPPFSLWYLPLHLLMKDNADDIAAKVVQTIDYPTWHPVVADIMDRAQGIAQLFTKWVQQQPMFMPLNELNQHIDFAFIALHGRPGEDGQLQRLLEAQSIAYNGSGPASSELTMNKFNTNERLMKANLLAPKHMLVEKHAWQHDAAALYKKIEVVLPYPLVAKPADEGCSSAVKRIDGRETLAAYCSMAFRSSPAFMPKESHLLKLMPNEEFPQKDFFVVENLVQAESGTRLMEVTVGLLTHREPDGSIRYEIFEPSETLAENAILSLEEKFLAGEGQNITPARFSPDAARAKTISDAVRTEIEKGARLLNIEGYARIDAFVKIAPEGQVQVEFIEANSLPAMTPATCIFHQSALNGYTPMGFILEIIRYGMARAGRSLPV